MRLAVAGLIAATAAVITAAPASAATSGHISGLASDEAGHVSLTLTAPGLPEGAGLDPSTVRLLVNGHQVPATARATETHQVAGAPVTAMLVIDTSGSMRGAGILAAQEAAREFLTAAPPAVRVGLETFADQARVAVPPTIDRRGVLDVLPALRTHGKTALFDALVSAAAATGHSGHRRLVVISDGADTVSHITLSAAISALHRAHVAVEVVGLHTAAPDNTVLRRLATNTGGRFVLAGDGAALAAALRSSARSYATGINVQATIPAALWGVDRRLVVTVASSAVPVVARATTSIGAHPVAAPSTATRDASKQLLWAGLLAIVLALLLGSAALLSGDAAGRRRARRLVDRYTVTPESKHKAETSNITRTALGLADRVAQSRGLHDRLTSRLIRAGLALAPSEWLLLQVGIVFVTSLTFVLFGMSPVVAVLGGVILGPTLGHLFLGFRFSRRRAAFVAALPDTLQLIAGSLSAGYSLAQSLDGVVSQGEQPISGEFGRALAESRLGVPIDQTLETVAERMDSEDFHWVVLAIQIQHKVGGNLAEVLLTVAQTMRERVQLHRHVRALSAEGRLSAYILGGLPVLFTLYLAAARGTYLRPLYTTKMGVAMIVTGFILFAIGSLVMKKMVKVEV